MLLPASTATSKFDPAASHSDAERIRALLGSTLHVISFTLLWDHANGVTGRRLQTFIRTLLSASRYLPHSLPASTLQFVDSAFAV
jgi:hypothetical protein